MKNLIKLSSNKNIFKKSQNLLFALLAIILFFACNGERRAEQMREEQLENAKEQTELSINEVRNDVKDRIQYLEDEIEQASGELEEKLKQSRKDLKDKLKRLDEELKKVEEATYDEWDKVLARVNEVVTDTRKKSNEVSKNVRELLDEPVED